MKKTIHEIWEVIGDSTKYEVGKGGISKIISERAGGGSLEIEYDNGRMLTFYNVGLRRRIYEGND